MKEPMTENGYKQITNELNNLINIKRKEIISDISEARAHGDLSENAEYKAAKEAQRMNEKRIRFLKKRLSDVQIINPKSINLSKVAFGATVCLEDENGEKTTLQIVGRDEANLDNSTISILSPLARAILGHKPGDDIEFIAPGGARYYTIISLKYI